ncbi:acyl carrier protein [Nocardia sp. NPDC004582]
MNTHPTNTADIVTWCREYLAAQLEVPADSIDPTADFDRLGVDSALAVALLIEVEERYGVDISPEDLFRHPTLTAVADYLHQRLSADVA